MAVSALPAFIDALVVAAEAALPDVLVFDGQGVTDGPGDFLMIGVDDPNAEDFSAAAEAQQTPATMGTARSRDERRRVYCAVMSWNGDGDMKAARDSAYTIAEGVATILRTTPNLGLSNVLNSGFGSDLSDSSIQADSGAVWIVRFSVEFRARI